mmetsp:Transcript_1529/g.6014  ORF Transcript_1529/g.6014 Transcript_1529/m.6014 type:complete len:258 (+) Transcript_1529:1436-2209(+)
MQRAHERAIAAVGERRDHQAAAVAQVLVSVCHAAINHLHVDDLVILHVVAQLGLPGEVGVGGDALVMHLHDGVPRMHIKHDECAERLALELGELAPHTIHNVHEIGVGLLDVRLQGALADGLSDLGRPVHLRAAQHDLARPLQNPLDPRVRGVCLVGAVAHVLERVSHRLLALDEPLLHLTVGGRRIEAADEVDLLLLRRVHGRDVEVLLELELGDAFEDLLAERLHAQRVLGLRENLQQLVVGQEVEAREGEALGL